VGAKGAEVLLPVRKVYLQEEVAELALYVFPLQIISKPEQGADEFQVSMAVRNPDSSRESSGRTAQGKEDLDGECGGNGLLMLQ
jgi:hypothetical protein